MRIPLQPRTIGFFF